MSEKAKTNKVQGAAEFSSHPKIKENSTMTKKTQAAEKAVAEKADAPKTETPKISAEEIQTVKKHKIAEFSKDTEFLAAIKIVTAKLNGIERHTAHRKGTTGAIFALIRKAARPDLAEKAAAKVTRDAERAEIRKAKKAVRLQAMIDKAHAQLKELGA